MLSIQYHEFAENSASTDAHYMVLFKTSPWRCCVKVLRKVTRIIGIYWTYLQRQRWMATKHSFNKWTKYTQHQKMSTNGQMDNLCDLTIQSDTGQHSQFLRCFQNSLEYWIGNLFSQGGITMYFLLLQSLVTGRHHNVLYFFGIAWLLDCQSFLGVAGAVPSLGVSITMPP